MKIDRNRFPLVFIRETDTPGVNAQAELTALLSEGHQFVLISEQHDHDEMHDSLEVRRARAQFFKENKGRLRELCAAAILIEGTTTTPTPIRLAFQGLGKALGVDFHFVKDEETAAAVGKDALARRNA